MQHLEQLNEAYPHCYFTGLNPKRISPFQFCLPALLGMYSRPNVQESKAKRFFEIHREILEGCTNRARTSKPCLKICPACNLNFFQSQMTSFEGLKKCHCLNFSKKCLRLHPAPSKCLSERINWIISRIPHWISKILFVQDAYESLAMLEGKTRKGLFFQGSI